MKVVHLACSEPESGFGFGLIALKISSVVGKGISDLGVELEELRSSGLESCCEKRSAGAESA